MTTRPKNIVDAKPPIKSKAATRSLPAKPEPVENNKSTSALSVKAKTTAKAAVKMANKNPVAKSVETTPTAVKAKKKLSKADKPKKIKMVHDSFTMPENDYSQFAALKKKCLLAGVDVKKSGLLRAGLLYLSKLSDSELINTIGQVAILKTGRSTKR